MDGWPALSIHGDKSQQERDWVLSEFKQNKSPIMLATDVAARGLGRTELDCTYVKLACMSFVSYQLLYKVHCGKLFIAKVPTLTAVWQACFCKHVHCMQSMLLYKQYSNAEHVDVDSVQGLVAHLTCSDLLSLSPLELTTLAACCCSLS